MIGIVSWTILNANSITSYLLKDVNVEKGSLQLQITYLVNQVAYIEEIISKLDECIALYYFAS